MEETYEKNSDRCGFALRPLPFGVRQQTDRKRRALEIALKDAGVEKSKAVDIDVERDSDKYSKWYEVEFHSGKLEYDYMIQAETGEILSSKAK